jgi:hypothetical protein
VSSREETPEHGTEEAVNNALRQQAEVGVLKLLAGLLTLKEGDLKGLEQQMMETIFTVGRGWMESMLSEVVPEEHVPSQRLGSCGHPQPLVGYRPKQVLTLLGKVTFRHAYYQCVVAEEPTKDLQSEAAESDASLLTSCTHGEAPADRR